jgi:hypothetical protein
VQKKAVARGQHKIAIALVSEQTFAVALERAKECCSSRWLSASMKLQLLSVLSNICSGLEQSNVCSVPLASKRAVALGEQEIALLLSAACNDCGGS